MNKIQGTIESISDVKQITEKFSKVEMVIITDDKYPQALCIEWPNDSAQKAQEVKVGDVVEVGINIRGRKWESPSGDVKYFTSLTGWSISLVSGISGAAPTPAADINPEEEDDDLPF